jgi:aspartate ammonia-lyase
LEINMPFRIEKDLLGEIQIENSNYYGINTARAMENFKLSAPVVNIRLIHDIALVKKAAANANMQTGNLSKESANAIDKACDEVINGIFDEQFAISSLQGGAGTSTNMAVNECVANRAIELLGGKKGDYNIIHPLNDVNMSQSTNDVYPTAMRIAAIRLIRQLADALADLQSTLQQKEIEFSNIIKLSRTQLMDALPMQAGQGFGAYAQAIGRDRWRIYKAEERLRHINIGGTAIGTGLNALPKYIFIITDNLQSLTGFGLSRAESPMDITQNADVFVEVSGLLKACAVNLMKISNDLRLLASGPNGGISEVLLPQMQAGSTIMPGKVNPVIPEMVAQVAIKVMANDYAITSAASMGQLELNAFLPIIADSLLQSLELLCDAVKIFRDKCILNIKMDEKRCTDNLEKSSALAAGLIYYIGYDNTAILAKKANDSGMSFREIVLQENILPAELIEKIFSLNEITKPGIPGMQ